MDVVEKDVMGIVGSMRVSFCGERFVLLPERGVYWERMGLLMVADVHLGKGSAFRAMGLPVPSGSSVKDLARLSALLETTGAERLMILGDLFHAKTSRSEEVVGAVAAWRERHQDVEMKLVVGNHDRMAGRLLAEWRMEEVEAPHEEEGFWFAHFPEEDCEKPTFCGHVHPKVCLRDFDGSGASVPCFVIEGNCVILPSFGSFTGGHVVERSEVTRIYITTGKRVVKLPKRVGSGV